MFQVLNVSNIDELEIQLRASKELFQQGLSLTELGKFEDAIACLEQAIKIKPDYHLAHLIRANIIWDLGRYEEALDSYAKTTEIKSDFYEAWFNHGVSLYSLSRWQEALFSWKEALKIEPNVYETWNFCKTSINAESKKYGYDKARQ